MNTMSSIKILDGFKSVLDTYALKFDGIKTRVSNRGKEIGDERKKYDDELSELLQSVENEKTRLIEKAYTDDSEARKLHQEGQRRIETSIRKREEYYDDKMSEVNLAAKTRKEYVDSCINLLQSTIEKFALFFNCEYLHDKNKKKSVLRDFPGNLSPLFGISKDDFLYWYKKYKYRSLSQQRSSASNEEYRFRSRISDIESNLETIRSHEEERQRYLRNNN